MKQLLTPALALLMIITLSVSCSKNGPDYIPKPIPGTENPPPDPQDPQNPQEPNPDSSSTSFNIKIRTEIKVGNVVYDSIPSSLMIRSWDSAQQLSVRFVSLKAGTNELTLSKSILKYELTISKWGLSEQYILNAGQFEHGKMYKLSGTKAIKLLRSEVTSILVDGVYKPDSKNTYLYNGDGTLSQIQYQRKKADGTPYLDVTDRFEYSGNRLQNITRFKPDAENGEIVQFIEFYYDHLGRVNRMREVNQAGETNATVEYHTIEGREETTLHYSYPGKTFTMNYYMIYEKGNLLKGNSLTSHHNSQQSMYAYDNQINPYHQMGWPDIFLSRSSKNNTTYEQTTYSGAYPIHVPYSFNYKYESDGYPTELVKQFRTYLNGQHAYTAKTTYYY